VIWIRSALFNFLFFGWTTIVVVVALPLLLMPERVMVVYARYWALSVLGLLRLVCGLSHRMVGREKVPDGGTVVASKHQSAWDTLAYFAMFDTPTYILKQELLSIPLFGWCLMKAGMIAVDRKGKAAALKKVIAHGERSLAEGRTIVIFPQGTRVKPGVAAPYQPGTAGLYTQLNATENPVELDSGRFWPRRSFLKYPGTITVEFLEPIAPGLPRAQFMRVMEERIETGSQRLLDSGAAAAS
jgi:1-acyl-sn-glycerol-3-phosphate acyltransferase